jgi:hypothetical protein
LGFGRAGRYGRTLGGNADKDVIGRHNGGRDKATSKDSVFGNVQDYGHSLVNSLRCGAV